MGTYINKGNMAFREARNGEYIDKSGLIAVINSTIGSRRKFSCVSRSRRFGKSMAAEMLCAYYDQSCDSRELFADLEIAHDPSFEQHLNKYPVIYLDMTRFTTLEDNTKIVPEIEKRVGKELRSAYPDVLPNPDDDMMDYMLRVVAHTGQRFIFIIDEWDAVCRIYNHDSRPMDLYVNWLRRMFKDSTATDCFAAVYMTGILPIKKYNTQSALNNFLEYSMVMPRNMSGFFGFTKGEVQMLAEKHGMSYDELEKWYDGYKIGGHESIFNPNSVMQAIDCGHCMNFWWGTRSIHDLEDFVSSDSAGLRAIIEGIIGGANYILNEECCDSLYFDIRTTDDILMALIHFGYLGYDYTQHACIKSSKEASDRLTYFLASATTARRSSTAAG